MDYDPDPDPDPHPDPTIGGGVIRWNQDPIVTALSAENILGSTITELPSNETDVSVTADVDTSRQVVFLIVDDSPATRKIVKRVLRSEGHTVFEAVYGRDCLVAVEREQKKGTPIDIILVKHFCALTYMVVRTFSSFIFLLVMFVCDIVS